MAQHDDSGSGAAAASSPLNLQWLPDEILSQIFALVPARDNLVGLQRVSKRINRVANENHLWRLYCLSEYLYWDLRFPVNAEAFKHRGQADWKALYRSRARGDARLAANFQPLIQTPNAGYEVIPAIARLGLDAKDFLLEQLRADPCGRDGLARRYCSRLLLDTIHRDLAIHEWSLLFLRSGREDPATSRSWERAHSGLDLFVLQDGPGGLDETSARLDQIASSFLEAKPGFDRMTTREKALRLLCWLRRARIFGPSFAQSGVRSLRGSLLGQTLHQEPHEVDSSVASNIYCSVARRLGLDAYRSKIPSLVNTVVRSPPGFTLDGWPIDGSPEAGSTSDLQSRLSSTHLFLAPAERWGHIPHGIVRDLASRNTMERVDDQTFLSMIEPSPLVHELRMVARDLQFTARRVLRSPQAQETEMRHPLLRGDVVRNARSCDYAASWAKLITMASENRGSPEWLTEVASLTRYMPKHWPEDIWLFDKYIAPLYPATALGLPAEVRSNNGREAESFRDNPAPPGAPPGYRSVTDGPFQVGQVFLHTRHNWYGIVISSWHEGSPFPSYIRLQDEINHPSSEPTPTPTPPKKYFFVCLSSSQLKPLFVARPSSMRLITNSDLVDLDAFPEAGRFFQRFDRSLCRFVVPFERA